MEPSKSADQAGIDQSAEIYRLAVEACPSGMVVTDGAGIIVMVNRETERLFGYTREELYGKSVEILVPERFRGKHPGYRHGYAQDPGTRLMGEGRDLHGLRKDGSEFSVEIGLNPIHTPAGLRILAVIADISARKHAEQMFRLVVESSPSGIVETDESGKILLVNKETERLFGYRREELIGQSVDTLVPPRFRGAHPRLRTEYAANPESRAMGAGRDLYGMRKDGSEFPVEIGLNAVRTDEGLRILSAIVDITERKMAEEKFRLAIEASPNGIAIADEQGKIVLLNAEMLRLFGYTREELMGAQVEILVPDRFRGGHPGHRAAYHASPEQRNMGSGRDLYGLRKDQSEFPVEIALNPIRTSEGTLVLSVVADITERKRAEQTLAAHAAELQRSNSDLEQFAYVASHDLQEPLRMVASYTQLLADRYQGKLDARADKYIGYAVDGAKRMQHLVNDLLTYSRIGTQGKSPKPIDSALALEASIRSLRSAIADAGGTVTYDQLPKVMADELQLGQVFQNLIGNALKFRAERPPQVHVSATRQGRDWRIAVADNGIGIEQRYSERVFQMFQRLHTRDKYEGSGIGLAVVKKIVERHGGRIWFESELGVGTTFYFTIPASESARQ